MSFLCGGRRRTVFLAKAITYFVGLLSIVLLPIAVSTAVVTTYNGMGLKGDHNFIADAILGLFCYILRNFS